jgi:hypothetical protein
MHAAGGFATAAPQSFRESPCTFRAAQMLLELALANAKPQNAARDRSVP